MGCSTKTITWATGLRFVWVCILLLAMSGCAIRKPPAGADEIEVIAIGGKTKANLPSATQLIRKHQRALVVDKKKARARKRANVFEIEFKVAPLQAAEGTPTTSSYWGRCTFLWVDEPTAFRVRCDTEGLPLREFGACEGVGWIEDVETGVQLASPETLKSLTQLLMLVIYNERPITDYQRSYPHRKTVDLHMIHGREVWLVELGSSQGIEVYEYFSADTGLRFSRVERVTAFDSAPIDLTTTFLGYQPLEGILKPSHLLVQFRETVAMIHLEYRPEPEAYEPIELPSEIRSLLH